MSDLTRLWIVFAAPPQGAAIQGVEWAPIVALARETRASTELFERCCVLWPIEAAGRAAFAFDSRALLEVGESSPPPLAAEGSDGSVEQRTQNPKCALDELARRHAGGQLAVVVPRELAAVALAESLRWSIQRSELPSEAWNVVVDWPAHDAPHLRAGLIGLDLDWVPPPPPKHSGRFPGGPGSAATRQR